MKRYLGQVRVGVLFAGLLGQLCLSAPVAAVTCQDPIELLPIPDMRVHVGFPVDYSAQINRYCGRMILFTKISGPPEFDIDGAGGLFYWTPARVATETITIQVTERMPDGTQVTDTETFTAIVDDNTMTYPLFRDYLEEATEVDIQGRAHGKGFVSYTVEYGEQPSPSTLPSQWQRIAGPIQTPVETITTLARWNITALPNGLRAMLRLRVQLSDGSQSVLLNPVIIDRTAKPGWPKRIGPLTHSVVVADLDDDGRQEVLALTHFGELYVWGIDGTLWWRVVPGGATYSAPSVGDLDGDAQPEIVFPTNLRLYAYRADGTPVPGFPVDAPAGKEFRTVPTLVDLDRDGALDIVIGAMSLSSGGGAVHAYRYNVASRVPEGLAGWPQSVDHHSIYASASVADLEGDGRSEVIVESYDRLYAWHADGTPVSGLHRAPLAVPIDRADPNGGGSGFSSSQPALADLDGDGALEIIVGSNVLRSDGTPMPGWEGGRPQAQNSLSAAIGDLDRNPQNGLEVVLGKYAWHADGTPVAGHPLSVWLSAAALGDCGDNDLDTLVGSREFSRPGIFAFHPDGAALDGYPKSLYGNTGDVGAPVVGDFDADGLVDVAVGITDASYGGVVAIYQMPGPNHDEHHDWPMLGHDIHHTGRYSPPAPNRPIGLSASSGSTGIALQWQDASAVEDGYLVEYSSSGAPWSFQAIAALPANSQAFLDAEAATGLAYYRVRAERRDPLTNQPLRSAPSNRIAIRLPTNLGGHIRTASGTPVPEVRIELRQGGALKGVATTDGLGRYQFGGLDPGSYRVKPKPTRQFRFQPREQPVTLENQHQLAIDFTAKPRR